MLCQGGVDASPETPKVQTAGCGGRINFKFLSMKMASHNQNDSMFLGRLSANPQAAPRILPQHQRVHQEASEASWYFKSRFTIRINHLCIAWHSKKKLSDCLKDSFPTAFAGKAEGPSAQAADGPDDEGQELPFC